MYVNVPPLTNVGVLGFLKIEIRRKPHGNFHTDFIKVMVPHQGGSTEERKVL